MSTAEAVWNHLKKLKDPAFGTPLSVVDVGLVYQVEIRNGDVRIDILMFNRGRVRLDAAASPIRQHVLGLEGVGDVVVTCRWDVAWTPERLSSSAREMLGFAADDPVAGRMHVRAGEKAAADAPAVDERLLARCRLRLDGTPGDLSQLSRSRFRAWWGGWRYFHRFQVKEYQGLARRAEPVHLDVAVGANQARDLRREIRLVEEQSATEVPCQVYSLAHEGAVQTCSVAFLATVAAGEEKTYLLLYGNASPACWPQLYPTDLVVRGQDYALQVENGVYRARLSPVMGQLRNLYFQQWGQTRLGWEDPSPVNVTDAENDPRGKLDIAWHGEDYCIHWNPDFRNQLRYRMTNWPEVPHYQVTQGAVFAQVARWGYPVCPVHPARDQQAVRLSVTYTFYQGLPYFTMESRLDVEEEADILVVRNDEWLFQQAFTHSLHMVEGERTTVLPADQDVTFSRNPELLGFCNQETGDAFASLRLAFDARGFPGAYDPAWTGLGATTYGNQIWFRDVFHVPEELAIQPGATAGEYNAYLCYNETQTGGRDQAADWYRLLRHPLRVTAAP